MDVTKTAYGSFCEDDYTQTGDQLNELTVTITLCEYRNLIREQVRNEALIDELQEKMKDIKKEFEGLKNIVIQNNPEIFDFIRQTINAISGKENEENEH